MTHVPSDRAAQRAWLVSLTGARDRGLIVDLGCGQGEDLALLAARHSGAGVRLVGVDASIDAPLWWTMRAFARLDEGAST